MRSAFIDLSPLRVSRPWRRLWVGNGLNMLGGLIGDVAVLWFIWELTHSEAWTGALALSRALPSIVLAFIGGSVADRVNRRTLAIRACVGQTVLTAAIAGFMFSGVQSPILLLVLVAVRAGFGAIAAPARKTFTVNLLPADKVPAGITLDHSAFQIALLAGPALGGVITGFWGPQACMVIDTLTFLASLVALWTLPSMKPLPVDDAAAQTGWRAAVAGLSFVRRTPAVKGAYFADLSAMVLAMPVALFPAINDAQYGAAPETLGIFMSAVAVGGIAASLLSGRVTASTRPGAIMLAAAAIWGVGVAIFGLTDSLWAGIAALALAGVGDTISVVARGALVQLATPDHLRGRVNAIDFVVGATGPDVGNFRAGLVGSAIGPAAAITGGGLMCVAGVALTAWLVPAARRFDTASMR